MEPKIFNFNVKGVEYKVEFIDANLHGALNDTYYFYFRYYYPGDKKGLQLNIGITDFVLDQWKRNGEVINEETLLDFCLKIIQPLLEKAETNNDVKVVIHRDDNVHRKEGVVYYKASESSLETAKNMTFSSDTPTNTQIRRKILEVCYSKWQEDPHGHVFKPDLLRLIPVSEVEIERNLKYLSQGGFIETGKPTTAGFVGARITNYGIDVFENQEEFNKLFSLKLEQQTINVGGDYISTVVVGNNNNTLVKSQVSDAFKDIEVEVEKREPQGKKEILGDLKELEAEIKSDSPDASKVKNILKKLGSKAEWVNEKILSHPILAQIIAQLLVNSVGK